MNKIYPKLYICWIVNSIIICLFLLMTLYPNYENNEFPLFTDFTIMIFLHAFFILTSILSHLFIVMLKNKLNINKKQIFLVLTEVIITIIPFLFSLKFMVFSLEIRILLSLISFIIISPHFVITKLLYKKAIQ